MSILVAVIYAAFISLGLPDAVVGAAWPTMAPELGADKAGAGLISLIILSMTMAVSFASGTLITRFGTFRVTATSVLLTAVALIGYGFAPSFVFLCLLAVPLGLGGGAIDAALNSYAALHFSARFMNLLHASWGIGASAGPLIVGLTLSSTGSWRPAYLIIAGLQFGIFALLVLTRHRWVEEETGRAEESARDADDAGGGTGGGEMNGGGTRGGGAGDPLADHAEDTVEDDVPGDGVARAARMPGQEAYHPSPLTPWFRIPGLPATLVGFLCYCALELATGLWAATFLALHHGFSGEVAAAGAAAFYIGVTGGRVLAAFATAWISNGQFLVGGSVLLALGAAIALFVDLPAGAIVGFALVGLGCAPIYPTTIKETTRRFGAANTPRLMGIQMGFAYAGQLVVPPLVGLLLTRVTPVALPVTVLVLALGVLTTSIYVERLVRGRERAAASTPTAQR